MLSSMSPSSVSIRDQLMSNAPSFHGEPHYEAPQCHSERAMGRSLVAAKSQTREMGSGPRIPALDRLIAAEIAAAAKSASEMPGRPPSELAAADRLFRRLIRIR